LHFAVIEFPSNQSFSGIEGIKWICDILILCWSTN